MSRLFFVAFVVLSPSLWATVFYVSVADGDDAHCTGSAPTSYQPGRNRSCPWKTIAKVNRTSFSAGDFILFKRGETWRESIIFPSAGKPGDVITIGTYGTAGAQPVISGADLLAGWSVYSRESKHTAGQSTYKGTSKVQPKRVWHGSTELTYAAGAKANLKVNQFDWASGILYINIGGDPNQETIEATARAYPLYVRTSYLVVDGLHFTKALEMNIISAHRDNDHVTIQNCTVDYAGMSGIFLYGDTAAIGHWTFLHNTVTHNGTSSGQDHGVYVSSSSNNLFEGNVFDENIGYGIQLQDKANNNVVRYNYFHANRFGGLAIWDNGKGFPGGNVIFGNVSNADAVGAMIGGSEANATNAIVNNTFFGYTSAGLSVHDNAHFGIFKNNILWSPASGAAALDDDRGSAGMISDYNLIGPATDHFIRWGGRNYSTLAAYRSGTGYDAHSISADPRFKNTDTADFTLLSDSPAIGSGTNLGAPYDVGLDPRTRFPWRTLSRTSWDIGSFAVPR